MFKRGLFMKKKFNKSEHKKENNTICVKLDITNIDRLKVIEEYYNFILENRFDANSIYAYLEYKKHLLDNIK